jgi:class 3 adenylate cyclase
MLPSLQAPTLVAQHKDQRLVGREVGAAIAAAIPGAEFLVLEGSMGHRDDFARVVSSFLARDAPVESRRDPAAGNAFRTILFTDIEGHTAMMQRLGDAKGREVLREHERVSREALRAHGGTEVKTIGDSFMASFPSAQKAVECAIALQRAFEAADCAGERLRIRVGINAGEPIAEEDDLFGSSVILASRTKEKAAGGEIFVTDVVRQLVSGKGFAFTDRGETEMKGFEEPVRLYEVRWG